ncbi:MAG: recombinase family protein [Planctomycetaceae bacterium]|nr:recombinase family protein [Planctomycetaceae bacterium]
MTKAMLFTRSTTGDHERQRDAIISKFGETHEIVAEYRDDGTKASVSKLLEESGAEVLLCTDVDRLPRQNALAILAALKASGVKIVTVSNGEIGVGDLIAQMMKCHTSKTESQQRGQRIKRGVQAARQRRKTTGG